MRASHSLLIINSREVHLDTIIADMMFYSESYIHGFELLIILIFSK